MGQELSYVAETGPDCRIYRSSSGRYVVRQSDGPAQGRLVATLACAYAACQALSGAGGPSAGASETTAGISVSAAAATGAEVSAGTSSGAGGSTASGVVSGSDTTASTGCS